MNKIVDIYFTLMGEGDFQCQGNFSGLKPAPASGGLTKNIGHNENIEFPNKCAIARGETFAERWLSVEGWASTRSYFGIDPIVMEVNNERHCPKCNKVISETALFCGHCGEGLDKNQKKLCSNNQCKKSILANARYCPYCGNKQ